MSASFTGSAKHCFAGNESRNTAIFISAPQTTLAHNASIDRINSNRNADTLPTMLAF